MLTINVNNAYNFSIENTNTGKLVNNEVAAFDLQETQGRRIHIIKDNLSYEAEVISFNLQEKSGTVKINSNTYHFYIRDQYDELLQKMGINTLKANSVSELRAPMPGLVLKILVKEGQVVKKGENILILEAMKMENIIKAPADVIIGPIKVKAGDKVEKNQVVIGFK